MFTERAARRKKSTITSPSFRIAKSLASTTVPKHRGRPRRNFRSFLRSNGSAVIAFLCVRPAIRKGKAEDDYAEEGMCVGMCLGLMLGSLSDSSNSGLGASLGMLFGLVIGLCMHKKGTEDRGNEK